MIGALSPNAKDPATLQAVLNGPRTDVSDVTRFSLDRFGQVTKIVNALGHTTTLTRGDTRWPGLVTQVQYPNNSLARATYDARGNTKSSTQVNPYGDGKDAPTRYEYTSTYWPDFPTRVVPPMADSVVVAYDAATGNRLWQEDARGSSSRVYFRYYGNGLLRVVDGPLTAPDSVVYDDAYVNLAKTKTPLGFWSEFRKDAIGRDTLVLTPISGTLTQQSRTTYSVMDQPTLVRTWAPAMNNAPAQEVLVQNFYDRGGALDSVARWSSPDDAKIGKITTRWRYDAIGRVVAEIAPDQQVDSTYYDPAGNAVKVRTRRHAQVGGAKYITMVYDALNRLTKRRVPAVQYAARNQGIPTYAEAVPLQDGTHAYPLYPNDGGTGYLIPTDSALFSYDTMGNITAANNADAQVSRTYYPSGALKTETQKIRTVSGTDFTTHSYLLQYVYDLNGRRTDLIHPAQLRAGASRDRTSWTYHPQMGALEQVTDVLGTAFRYGYDAEGRVNSLTLPGGISESYAYDGDSRLGTHRVLNQSTSAYKWSESYLRSATFGYDSRGKITHTYNTAGTRDTLLAWYSGQGHVVKDSVRSRGRDAYGNTILYTVRENFTYDALANSRSSQTQTRMDYSSGYTITRNYRTQGYLPGSGRQAYSEETYERRDTMFYDPGGNTDWMRQAWTTQDGDGEYEDRASYYASDGTLRAADHRRLSNPGQAIGNFYRTAFEEYRYDALGRRVWVRARRWCENDPDYFNGECRIDKIKRVVWDGEQELYEIQMPGEDGNQYLENDTAQVKLPADTYDTYKIDPNPFFGRVSFTPGLSLDQPVGMVRMGYGDLIDESNTERPHRALAPFAIMPLWTHNGQADNGTFADGGVRKCETISGITRCVYIQWPAHFYAYARHSLRRSAWHGSMVEDKKDAAGTHYRRNRHYDPSTGRFTQEDPIGLAGGINLYGFGGGDPVNFSDPFGLRACDPPEDPECKDGGGKTMLAAAATVAVAEPTPAGEAVLLAGLAAAGIVLAGDAALDAAGDAVNRVRERTYVTYTLTNASGQTYVGRASGYGTPQQVMMQRFSAHERRLQGFGNPQLDASAQGPTGRFAIRGREQQLIDAYGGVGSARLANAIRGVARANPLGRIYHTAANSAFGNIAPYTGY